MTASYWAGGAVPATNAEVHFGDQPGSLRPTILLSENRMTRTLWFDAGKWFTIRGSGLLSAGNGLGSGRHFLAVTSAGYLQHSEVNIDNNFQVGGPSWGKIRNDSEAGLRFGGLFRLQSHLRIEGRGATHIAGPISLNGTTASTRDLEAHSYGIDDDQPHLILSGNNALWSGELRVKENTFVVIKANGALGTGANNVSGGGGTGVNAWTPGTLGFRSHLAPAVNGVDAPLGLTYTATAANISVRGLGITRRNGVGPVGAIYNDGGSNIYQRNIELGVGEVGFGARGDRQGSLYLTGSVAGPAGSTFVKLGTGRIVLLGTASGFNRAISIRGGVLGSDAPNLSAVHLSLAGGIFESAGTFTRPLGSGVGRVFWAAGEDGGFSAFGGGNLNVYIGGQTNPTTLNWGQGGFVSDGAALLLSSRYATDLVYLHNKIELNGGVREVRTERGGFGSSGPYAHGVITGQLLDASKNSGILKTGRGLLHLSNTANGYQAPTIIREGALMGWGSANNSSGISHLSNIQLDGGVLMLHSATGNGSFFYAPTLGTGAGQLRWTGSGGFAVWRNEPDGLPGLRFVAIQSGGVTATLSWGVTPGFVGNGQELRFGHYTANGTVIWQNEILMGSGNRTIRLERGRQIGPDLAALWTNAFTFLQMGSGGAAAGVFNLVGDGHLATSAHIRALFARQVNIYGTQWRVFGGDGHIIGMSTAGGTFNLGHGGEFIIDNRYGLTPNDTTGGGARSYRLSSDVEGATPVSNASLRFNAGSFKLIGTTVTNTNGTIGTVERIKNLEIASGANAITIQHFGNGQTELHADNLLRDDMKARSTLLVTGGLNGIERLRLTNSAEVLLVNDGQGHKIFPWAIENKGDWLTQTSSGGQHHLAALATYHTNTNTTTWGGGHNVSINTNNSATLGDDRKINSLRLWVGSSLDLGLRALTINSGGLISAISTITGKTGSYLTTGFDNKGTFQRPLYAHVMGELTIDGAAQIGNAKRQEGRRFDLVKTLPGTLFLKSRTTHEIGSLYIHQGTVDLVEGTIDVGREGRIYIGDGAGTDVLKLAPNRWDQLTTDGRPLVSITLRGTPYDPRGPEYGGGQAILQLGGNTKQHIATLHIENRGTIDWVGGEVGKANILWIENLTFSGPDAQLFIRNWYEYEDILLVRKVGFREGDLPKIIFEGYQDYTTTWKSYDGNYYQITPFVTPEPQTYGAIVVLVGVGLVAWRKKGRKGAVPFE